MITAEIVQIAYFNHTKDTKNIWQNQKDNKGFNYS
jgi:hypothetical protein